MKFIIFQSVMLAVNLLCAFFGKNVWLSYLNALMAGLCFYALLDLIQNYRNERAFRKKVTGIFNSGAQRLEDDLLKALTRLEVAEETRRSKEMH